MRISFVVPFLWFTGGLRVVFEYAHHLTERGHVVSICYPLIPYTIGKPPVISLLHALQGIAWNIKHWNRVPWSDYDLPLRPAIPFGAGWKHAVPDSDAVVATSWQTAYTVHVLPRSKGAKAYLIQDHETWEQGSASLVDRTFTLPLTPIVISSWLRELVHKKSGRPLDESAVIVNGVNLEQFHNPHKVFYQPRRILMIYRTEVQKGTADGIRAFEIARQQHPDVGLVMMGLSRGPSVPAHVEFHENPPQDRLWEIYSSCDIFVSPSWQEGCQLPPMEAMACQCAVVATNVGGIPDYAIAGQTALVSEPRDPEALAQNIIRLLDDGEELRRISRAGYEHIQEFTWERATDKLERVLASLVAQ